MRKTIKCGWGCLLGILALASVSLEAEEFTGTITLTNCAVSTLKFGLRTDNEDGFDRDAVDPDVASPPAPPTGGNYVAFWISGYLLKEDYRLDPAPDGKLWPLVVNNNDLESPISLSWTLSDLDQTSSLTLLNSAKEVIADMKTVSTLSTVVGGTYYIRYGAVEIADRGSVDVTINKTDGDVTEGFANASWYITKSTMTEGVYDPAFDVDDANLSYYSASGLPILRNGVATSGKRIEGVKAGTYLIHFTDVDASWTTPDPELIVIPASQADPDAYVVVTYNRISAVMTVSPLAVTTSESGGKAAITVSVGAEPTANISVELTVSDATVAGIVEGAGVVASKTLTFTSENWDTAQVVEVKGVEDINTTNDAYTVSFTVTSDDDRYEAFTLSSVNGVTVDNDTPGITVIPQVGLITTEDQTDNGGGSDAQFTVKLNTEPGSDVVLNIVSLDLGEGTVTPATLTFSSADWNTAQTVSITGVDDGTVDGDVPYNITVSVDNALSDASYENLSKTVSVTNLDDDVPTPSVDLSFLPSSTVDFGEVYVGEEKTTTVTVVNLSDSVTANLGVAVTAEGQFTVKAAGTTYASTDVLTLQPGASKSVKVKYTAGADGENHQDTLTFTDSDQADAVVKVIALAGSTIAPPAGGILQIKQPLIVAKGTDSVQISFDIELNTADPDGNGDTSDGVAYQFFLFEITLPAVVSNAVFTTNTSRTDGKAFSEAVLENGNIELSWVDLAGEKSISAADGTLLSVTATVDVTGSEATYPIYLSNVKNAAADGQYTIATQGATLAVSQYVSLANLDVNGTGTVTFHDVVYIYRYVAMEKRADDGLRPSALYQLGPDTTIEDVEQNIADLIDNGLDVNGSGTVTFHDVVYVYRYVAMEKRADDGLRPSALYQLGPNTTIEDVEANIESIYP